MSPIGLPNIGTTCWLNSVLQLIINSNILCNVILENKDKGPIHTSLSNVIHTVKTASEQHELSESVNETNFQTKLEQIVASYRELHSLICSLHPIFTENSCNDCHEVITYLINALHEESKYDHFENEPEQILYSHNAKSLSNILLTTSVCIRRIASDNDVINESFTTFFVEHKNENDLQTTLNLTRFIYTPRVLFLSIIIQPNTSFNLNNMIRINEKIYTLYGMIYFIPHMRHYISMIRKDEQEWYLLNDASCNVITNEDVARLFNYYPTIIAYCQR